MRVKRTPEAIARNRRIYGKREPRVILFRKQSMVEIQRSFVREKWGRFRTRRIIQGIVNKLTGHSHGQLSAIPSKQEEQVLYLLAHAYAYGSLDDVL